jgi:hypothetical protein
MYATELRGLADQQLDFESDRWEWSKWSIRRNASHVVSGDFRWLLLRWGEQIFPQGLPRVEDLDGLARSPYDRRLDERKYWRMESILRKMRESLDLCLTVLARETVASMRTKELATDYSPQLHPAHSVGIRRDTSDPTKATISLEATMRHRWWEYVTHLYNIQRLKRAQGLVTRVELPREGYWVMPGWDTSEA